MAKHKNPLEKELLIRMYLSDTSIKLSDFCKKNDISDSAFRNWLKQGGLEALARADAEIKEILPEGLDRTEENYRREILKLRIENERLKKNYTVRTNEAGEQEYIHLRPKNTQ